MKSLSHNRAVTQHLFFVKTKTLSHSLDLPEIPAPGGATNGSLAALQVILGLPSVRILLSVCEMFKGVFFFLN